MHHSLLSKSYELCDLPILVRPVAAGHRQLRPSCEYNPMIWNELVAITVGPTRSGCLLWCRNEERSTPRKVGSILTRRYMNPTPFSWTRSIQSFQSYCLRKFIVKIPLLLVRYITMQISLLLACAFAGLIHADVYRFDIRNISITTTRDWQEDDLILALGTAVDGKTVGNHT